MGPPRKQIQMQDKKKTKQMRSEGKWTRVSISSEIIMNRQCWGEQGGPQRQSERLLWNNLIYNAANMQHLKLCSFHWNKISGSFGWATHVKVQWQKDLMGKIRQKTWKKNNTPSIRGYYLIISKAGNKIHFSLSNQAVRHKLLGHTARGHCCLGLKHWHCTALVIGVRGCWHWAWVFNRKLSSMVPVWQRAHFWA